VGPLLLPVFHLKSTTPRLKLLWQQHFVHTLKRQQPQIYLIWTINMPECQTLSNAEDEVTWPHECKTDLRDEFMTDIDGLPRIQNILQNMLQNVAGDSIYPFPHCCSFFTPAPFGPSLFLTLFLRLDLVLIVRGLRRGSCVWCWLNCSHPKGSSAL